MKIDYDKSVIKTFEDSSYEIAEIIGTYKGEHFKVVLSSTYYSQNNEAKCIEGDLTREQITEVLKKFDSWNCSRKEVKGWLENKGDV